MLEFSRMSQFRQMQKLMGSSAAVIGGTLAVFGLSASLYNGKYQ